MTKYGENKENDDYRMLVITINITKKADKIIKKLISWGIVPSRSEYIRTAIKRAIKEDLEYMKEVDSVIETRDPTKIVVPNGDGTYQKYNLLRRLG